MKKWVMLGGLALFFIIFQSTFFTVFDFKIFPDIPLLFVVNTGVLAGPVAGGALGLISGVFQDMVYGDIIGIYGLGWLIAGTGVGIVSKNLYRTGYFIVFILTVLATFFGYFAACLMLTLLSEPVSLYRVAKIAVYKSVFNAFLALPVYAWVKKSNSFGL